MIAMLIETALEDIGMATTLAANGDEAMELLTTTACFQALVTDIRMGRSADGWAVAAKAREVLPSIQVIYITGDSMDDWRSKGVPESVLLTKPFLPAQMVTAVTTLLNRPEAQVV